MKTHPIAKRIHFFTNATRAFFTVPLAVLAMMAMIFGTIPLPAFAQDFHPVVRLETVEQNSSVTPGQYVETFKITSLVPLDSPAQIDLDIFKQSDPSTPIAFASVTLSAGSNPPPVLQNVDGLVPGTYTAALYSGSTKISQTTFFSITDTYYSATDGITITYPPEDQVINKTSATIKGQVTTQVSMPVRLSFISGLVGSPLGNERALLSLSNLDPGNPVPITMTFTGLSEGQSYQFAVKNLFLNKTSAPLQFTTKSESNDRVGLTYGGALAPYVPSSGTDGVPQDITVEDTISDQGIVPKCGRTQNSAGTIPEEQLKPCGYSDFLQLISNILQYAIIIIGPIVACIVLYSGAMIIWLGKDKDPSGWVKEQMKAHGARLVKVAIGVAIILLAWMIVATILRELGVKPDYTFLDIFN